jgi:DDE family transposase
VSVPHYRETLGSLLYPGFVHSLSTLKPTIELTERLLRLKAHQHHSVVWRLDGGYGSDEAINWVLARDYQLVAKGYNSRRAQKVVRQVPTDAWQRVHEHKWVAAVAEGVRYARRTQTLAVRWVTESGQERCALLIHTLLNESPLQVVEYYDGRGSMESEIKQDKLGLHLVRRRKQRWEAQEAWVLLTDVAHNLLTWTHDWMWLGSSFDTWGHLRLVHDVLTIPGYLAFKGTKLEKVALHRDHPFAAEMQVCLARLFRELS